MYRIPKPLKMYLQIFVTLRYIYIYIYIYIAKSWAIEQTRKMTSLAIIIVNTIHVPHVTIYSTHNTTCYYIYIYIYIVLKFIRKF